MKKIAFLLALIMAVAAVAMPIGAEDSKKYVVLYDFDNAAEGMTSTTTVDKENNVDGSGCFSCCTTGNTPTISAKFDAVDVSDCDYLAFWLYLEDASLAGKFTYGRIEVTSSGKSGTEDIWYPICKKDNFPDCWLPDLIEGGAKAGWNLVKLPLNVTTGTPTGGQIKVNTNAADRTKINYFRIYGTDAALVNKTVKVDTLFAYQEGAAIPEPQKTVPEVKDPLFVKIFDFDKTAEGMSLMTTIDNANNVDGSGCFSYCTTGNTPSISAKFAPVDISGCDYLAFWLYLEDASLADKFTTGRVEITSSGKSGAEDIWYPICKKDNFPDCWLPDLIEGGAKAGWNLVKLPLNVTTGTPTGDQIKVNTNAADRTKINYFRIYGSNTALANKTIKVDTLFAYTEGTEIPAPQKDTPKDPVFVKVFDFDTVTASSAGYDTPVIDSENHLNGDGCYTLKTDPNGTHPNIPILEAKFDPVDISDCDYLCFWLYLESPDLATKFAAGRIELNSSGIHNESTDLYVVTGNASGYPNSVIANLIEGGAKAGWNLVKIPLDTSLDNSAFKVYHDNADRTKINYFRLQCTANALIDKTIKLDYMYAYSEGAEVPAPQKNVAPETQPPETEAPETNAPEPDAPGTDAPTEAPTDPVVDPHPATFDATASIAIVTVAAMGIVLVSSKKRH